VSTHHFTSSALSITAFLPLFHKHLSGCTTQPAATQTNRSSLQEVRPIHSTQQQHNRRMSSFTTNLNEQAAAACLVRMNSQQLNHDECDGASDVLFHIYSEMSGESLRPTNEIKLFKPTTESLAMPLASPKDADFLSPLQIYIRQHCVEYFEATELEDESKQQRGRRSPIVFGRVGIRCVFCKHSPDNERASQSTAFPSNLEKIYSSVVVSVSIFI
jgi:hypothetical protein